MPDRQLKLHDLCNALRRYGVWEEEGKRHKKFLRNIDGCVFTYPIPRHGNEVKQCYVAGVRKKFKLTKSDGISDEEFYG
jgi:hypothetical protein